MKRDKVCLYFHQGWTDIMMCLPLINYYSSRYSLVEVLMRDGSRPIIDFYIRTLPNVRAIYLTTDQGRFYGRIIKQDVNSVEYIPNTNDVVDRGHGMIKIPLDYDIMFHAEHDSYREDIYQHRWLYDWVRNPINTSKMHFSEAFYTLYDLDFMERVTSFEFTRDVMMENLKLEEFTYNFGENYVLYHDDTENHLRGGLHKSTKIKFESKLNGCEYINLNQKSDMFFDYIKILQKSKEIHFVDSVWAAFCYQLDSKYKLFENVRITVDCQRGHTGLFLRPVSLSNWKVE